jgi:hypothetical protein
MEWRARLVPIHPVTVAMTLGLSQIVGIDLQRSRSRHDHHGAAGGRQSSLRTRSTVNWPTASHATLPPA